MDFLSAGGTGSSMDEDLTVNITTNKRFPTKTYEQNCEQYVATFATWNEHEQLAFVETLLKQMHNHQHGQVNAFLSPMLQRDFLGCLSARGLEHVAEKILGYLDDQSLKSTELVCHDWYHVIAEGEFQPWYILNLFSSNIGMLWKKLVEKKFLSNALWRGLADRRGWARHLFRQLINNGDKPKRHEFYRQLYPQVLRDIDQLEMNWRSGNFQLKKIQCRSQNSKGVYCLQYDDEKIVSGLRDNTIKIWDRKTLECTQVLTGHNGSVLCLQYDDKVIVTGSSDSTVRVWNVKTGELINTLLHHCEAVLHLRFYNGTMVTCSKDRSIAVWQMNSPLDITIRRVLVGHRAAVNVVDFDEKYIVSASGDRTIKVWVRIHRSSSRSMDWWSPFFPRIPTHASLFARCSATNAVSPVYNIEIKLSSVARPITLYE